MTKIKAATYCTLRASEVTREPPKHAGRTSEKHSRVYLKCTCKNPKHYINKYKAYVRIHDETKKIKARYMNRPLYYSTIILMKAYCSNERECKEEKQKSRGK